MNKKLLFISFSLLLLSGCFNNPKPQDNGQQNQQNTTNIENNTGDTCSSGDSCQVPLTGTTQSDIQKIENSNVKIETQSGDDQQTIEIKKDLEKLLNE